MMKRNNSNSTSDLDKNASMAVSGSAAGPSLEQKKGNKDKNVIKIGLIGCGGRGTGAAVQALNAHPSVKLVALADIFDDKIQETLRLVKAEFPDRVDVPVSRQFVGFEGYLGLINEVDVMLNATPPHFRPQHAEACANAGKHMFLEKPVAVDVAGVKKMMEVEKIVKEKGLVVTVGLQRHYSTNVLEIVKRIGEGVIGDIVCTRGFGNFGMVNWLKQYPRTPGMTEMEYQMRNWYFFNWLSGDVIVEQTVHYIDCLSFFRNGVYPVSAQGSGGRAVRNGPDAGDIFDHFAIEYTYADNTKSYVMSRQQENTWFNVSVHADGTLGTCATDRVHLRGKEVEIFPRDKVEAHQAEQNAFFADIIAGKPRNDLHYAIPSTMMAILGRMAAYSGVVVKWDEAFASNENLSPAGLSRGSFKIPYSFDIMPPNKPGPDGIYPYPMPGTTKPF